MEYLRKIRDNLIRKAPHIIGVSLAAIGGYIIYKKLFPAEKSKIVETLLSSDALCTAVVMWGLGRTTRLFSSIFMPKEKDKEYNKIIAEYKSIGEYIAENKELYSRVYYDSLIAFYNSKPFSTKFLVKQNTERSETKKAFLERLRYVSLISSEPPSTFADLDRLYDILIDNLQEYPIKLRNKIISWVASVILALISGTMPQPLYIYGCPGCGKTRLINMLFSLLKIPLYSATSDNIMLTLMPFGNKIDIVQAAFYNAYFNQCSTNGILLDECDKILLSEKYGKVFELWLLEILLDSEKLVSLNIDNGILHHAVIDMRKCVFILIGNELPKSGPLRSRLTFIHMPNLATETKREIISRELMPKEYIELILKHTNDNGIRTILKIVRILNNIHRYGNLLVNWGCSKQLNESRILEICDENSSPIIEMS